MLLLALLLRLRSVINAQDELNKLSQRPAYLLNQLAGIGFAAEQSGVEIEKSR